ncbi:MAG: hypothetical protein LH606_09980 [Cytophagaceae bacterium]|nr:hypothetical protein [Cytophagaceae bacterium]
MKRFWIRRGLKFFAFGLLFMTLASLAVMGLWNALLPALFAVPAIGFGQALGLLVLSRILFGGFGRGGWGGRPGGHGAWRGDGRADWKQKMEERWKNLTPEQRDKMRQRWESKCGGRGRWERPQTTEPAEPTTTSL